MKKEKPTSFHVYLKQCPMSMHRLACQQKPHWLSNSLHERKDSMQFELQGLQKRGSSFPLLLKPNLHQHKQAREFGNFQNPKPQEHHLLCRLGLQPPSTISEWLKFSAHTGITRNWKKKIPNRKRDKINDESSNLICTILFSKERCVRDVGSCPFFYPIFSA